MNTLEIYSANILPKIVNEVPNEFMEIQNFFSGMSTKWFPLPYKGEIMITKTLEINSYDNEAI